MFKRRQKSLPEPGFPTLSGAHYQHVISALEQSLNPEWYLEIGSRTGSSLARRHCNFIAIDPEFQLEGDVLNGARSFVFRQETSDDFFASGYLERNEIKPELAFIDGMHLFEFALRDFINLERVMAPGGVICVHDVCPFNRAMTTRDTSYLRHKLPWTGDVWKLVHILRTLRPDLNLSVLNASSTGLAVISGLSPDSKTLSEEYDSLVARYEPATLDDFGVAEVFELFSLDDADAFIQSLRGA